MSQFLRSLYLQYFIFFYSPESFILYGWKCFLAKNLTQLLWTGNSFQLNNLLLQKRSSQNKQKNQVKKTNNKKFKKCLVVRDNKRSWWRKSETGTCRWPLVSEHLAVVKKSRSIVQWRLTWTIIKRNKLTPAYKICRRKIWFKWNCTGWVKYKTVLTNPIQIMRQRYDRCECSCKTVVIDFESLKRSCLD